MKSKIKSIKYVNYEVKVMIFQLSNLFALPLSNPKYRTNR